MRGRQREENFQKTSWMYFEVLFDHLVVSYFMYASCKGVFNFVRMKDISVGIFSTRVHDHKENYLKLSTT